MKKLVNKIAFSFFTFMKYVFIMIYSSTFVHRNTFPILIKILNAFLHSFHVKNARSKLSLLTAIPFRRKPPSSGMLICAVLLHQMLSCHLKWFRYTSYLFISR